MVIAESTTSQQVDDEMADLLAAAGDAVVQVRSGGRRVGAGTVWHDRGLIISNAHVAAGGPLEVTLADGRTLDSRLIARSEELDIAALAVDAEDLPAIALGESTSLKPGHLVVALGHPWGIVGAAASGVVIGIGSWWPEAPRAGREWIVASMRLRPGNSGGPLLDSEGRLVGMNTMISGPEVGMAVPVHVVKRFLHNALGSRQPGS
jgi:serine protease Do